MQFFIVDQLLGGEDGPFTKDQIVRLIQKKKLKRKNMIRFVDREGLFRAEDVFTKAFVAVEEKEQQRTEANTAAKREAKDKAREEKSQSHALKQKQKAETKQASQLLAATTLGPYRGFEFVKTLINIIVAMVLIASVLSILGIAYRLVMTLANYNEYSGMVIFGLAVQLISTLAFCILIVGAMLFQRNFIDWMLNMEQLLINLVID